MQAQAVQQLVFGEQAMRTIIDCMPEAAIIFDREGQTVWFNRAAEELLGVTGREMAIDGSAFDRNVFLADAETPCPIDDLPFVRALRGESVRDRELFIRNPALTHGRWVNASASALHDTRGQLAGAILICQDQTARKDTELHRELLLAAVMDNEVEHRLLSESVPQLVWTCRPDGSCDYLNTRWAEYTGVPQAEHLGSGWVNALHPEDRERARQAWMAAVREDRAYDVEYRLRSAEGEYRWFKARSLAFRDNSGKVVRWFGTSTDIDDQKRIEQELERRSEELARSNADLQRFAYIAAHDLREPLRTIGAFTELLARKLPAEVNPATRELTGYIGAGVARMDALIGGLLSYATMSAAEPDQAAVDCNAVLRTALFDLNASIQESHATVVAAPLPTVFGDEIALLQLFENLIGNALKYRGSNAAYIHMWAERDGACWRFAVKDRGIGIDPRFHEQIFGLFTRLHGRHVEGIGLGLAYCKKIVEKHRGRIWVESDAGQGSTFYFTLPAAAMV